MKNHIAEELPARKHAPAAAGAAPTDKGDKKDDSGKSPEQRAKQAVYDIRYRARREDIPLRQAFSQYMQNSSMSGQEKNIVKAKLFGKEGGGMKAEDFNPIFKDAASDTVAKALFKVFVEGKEQEPISLTYSEELDSAEHRKYKVRVTDKNTKKSYVRMATREKINQLRANPNIESVEMTQYGEPYEGEKKKGSQTARVAAGKGLDPVGQEDKDIDNDGDHDKNDKYLLNRRKVRGSAIETRKEEFIHEAETEDSNTEKIDVMKKGKRNKVTVAPEQGKGLMAHNELEGELIAEKAVSQAQQRFMGMVYAAKKGKPAASPEVAKAAKGITKKEAKKFASTTHKGLPVHKEAVEPKGGGSAPNVPSSVYKFVDELPQNIQKIMGSAKTKPSKPVKEAAECEMDEKPKLKKSEGGVEDSREIPTKVNLVKNKLRAMGLKMSYEPEGEVIDELRRSEKEGLGSPDAPLSNRGQNKERGERGGRRFYSGGQGGSTIERGKKKGEPGSQQQRLNPPEKTGRQLNRGSAAARQSWHSARD